jgi:hypothetical protein
MTIIHANTDALQLDLFEWAREQYRRKCEREDDAFFNRSIDLLEQYGVDKLTDIPGWYNPEEEGARYV